MTVVIKKICITRPGHWDNYDYFLIVITDFWLLGSRTGLQPLSFESTTAG